jgi:glutamyl-tRNA reductase
MAEIKKGLVVLKQNSLDLHKPFINKLDEVQKEDLNVLLDAYSDKIIKVIMMNLRKASTKEEMISITNTLKNSFTIETHEEE